MAVNTKEKKEKSRDKDITNIPVTDTSQDRQFLSSEDLDLNALRQLLLEAQKNAESAKATVTEVMTNIYSEKQTQEKDSENLTENSDNITESNIEQPTSTELSQSSHENDSENAHSQLTQEEINNEKRGLWHRIRGKNSSSINMISEIKPSVFINKSTDPDIKKELYNLSTKQNKQLYQLIDNAIEERSQEKIRNIVGKAKSEIAAAQVIVSQAKREVDDAQKQVHAAKEETRRAKGAAEETIHIARKQIESSRQEIAKLRTETLEAIHFAEESIKLAQEEADAEKQAAKILVDQSKQEINIAKEEARVARETAKKAKAQAEEKAYSCFRDEISGILEQVESTKNEALEIIARSREDNKLAKYETEKAKKAGEQAVQQAQAEILKAKEEAERIKQTATEEVVAMKEELRKYREDAEACTIKTNEVVTQASYDIVHQTSKEMPGMSLTSGEDDPNYIATKLHEMQAPLHSISGYARLMLEDDVPDYKTHQEFISFLVQQSDTLNRLLDDLTGNLAGTGRLKLNRTIVSPSELINDVIQSMRNSALEKDILIGSTIPDTLPTVDADSPRIKQVLVNLIDNAIKYNEGDSTVIIKTQIMETELMILVEDHGIGIPEDETLAIFDDYYRASNHGDKEGQGLGLGICKRIVESHGGSIQVESVEGVGSTFGFTLPLTHV